MKIKTLYSISITRVLTENIKAQKAVKPERYGSLLIFGSGIGYYGQTRINHGSGGLYFHGSLGTEYRINNKKGLFSYLSTGGMAVDFKKQKQN